MKRIVCLFAFTPMLGSVLYGDWKTVTRIGNSSVTEFFKGALIRQDYLPAYTSVLDFDHRARAILRHRHPRVRAALVRTRAQRPQQEDAARIGRLIGGPGKARAANGRDQKTLTGSREPESKR